MSWTEDAVIESAIEHYRKCGLSNYGPAVRMDQLKDHRNYPEIDAVSVAKDQLTLAIEHTRLESFTGQMMDDVQVSNICVSLAKEISSRLSLGLSCIIPVQAFIKGFDWAKARSQIETYLLTTVGQLQVGYSDHSIAGIPFRIKLHLDKHSKNLFYFLRESPPKTRIKLDLLASMEKALTHKRDRLNYYKSNGYRTALLLESNDVSLISHIDAHKAFLRAECNSGSDHVNDILFGHVAGHKDIDWLCFKSAGAALYSLNPPQFMIAPEHREYWQETMNEEESI